MLQDRKDKQSLIEYLSGPGALTWRNARSRRNAGRRAPRPPAQPSSTQPPPMLTVRQCSRGRYEIKKCWDRRMGVVRSAHDRELDEPVAIKTTQARHGPGRWQPPRAVSSRDSLASAHYPATWYGPTISAKLNGMVLHHHGILEGTILKDLIRSGIFAGRVSPHRGTHCCPGARGGPRRGRDSPWPSSRKTWWWTCGFSSM